MAPCGSMFNGGPITRKGPVAFSSPRKTNQSSSNSLEFGVGKVEHSVPVSRSAGVLAGSQEVADVLSVSTSGGGGVSAPRPGELNSR